MKAINRFIDDMTNNYVACALWSSTDSTDESGGEPLDQNYSYSDLPQETIADMRAECRDFLHYVIRLRQEGKIVDGVQNITAERMGHDFWLTRNRHGAGFWDRDLGELGRQLTDAAHTFGEAHLYIGDDGGVYVV
jgi:hypothetical protein